jgi:prepilin-type N-terminal cleavage/methylation domain-containing protein
MRKNRRAAFTLIEVLVAMVLSGMVTVMALVILDSAVDQQKEMVDIIDRRNAGSKIVAYLRKDFQGLMDLTLIGEASSVEIVKDPREQTVVNFISNGRRSVNDEGVVSAYNEVGYALRVGEENNEVYALYRRRDFFVDDELFRGGTYELLADGIKSFKIEFASAQAEWTEEWTEGYPSRVRITLEILSVEAQKNLSDLPISNEDWDTEEYVDVISLKY